MGASWRGSAPPNHPAKGRGAFGNRVVFVSGGAGSLTLGSVSPQCGSVVLQSDRGKTRHEWASVYRPLNLAVAKHQGLASHAIAVKRLS